MIEKIIDAWIEIYYEVCNGYVKLPYTWLTILLLPIFVVYSVLYMLVLAALVIVYSIEGWIKYGITLRESFDAFKEGIKEGLNELKG